MSAVLQLPAPGADDIICLVSALLSIVFLVFLPWRIWQLGRVPIRVEPNVLSEWKITFSLLYTLGTLLALVLRRRWRVLATPIDDVQLALRLVSSIGVAVLSFREQRHAPKPSTLIALYLAASAVCDVVRVAAPSWSLDVGPERLLYSQIIAKFALLVAECRRKTSGFVDGDEGLPPEQSSGIFSRIYFWWIHELLVEGYSTILSSDKLLRIDSQLDTANLRRKALLAWDRRVKPETLKTLPKVLFGCFSKYLIIAVIPRLFMIAFRFSQAMLVNQAIAFVQYKHAKQDALGASTAGFWLVTIAIIVYFGLATSTAIYQHQMDRLHVMVRGSLVGLIHHKALNSPSRGYGDVRAVTLMSNDVSSLEDTAFILHEVWAQFLEAVVGFGLLASQIGWLWPLPLLIILFFTQTSRYAVKPLKSRQSVWNTTTQQRISMTSAILGSIKIIKMLGIQTAIESLISRLRESEVNAAKRVGWVEFAYNASANANGLFAPVFTLALYAIIMALRGQDLDTKTAFTTVALLSMVTHPVNMVMTYIPRAIACLPSFERIQAYLLEPALADERKIIAHSSTWNDALKPAIVFQGVTVIDTQSSKPILQHIDLKIERGSLSICTGPVGCGKSALMHAALGEFKLNTGFISVSSNDIAFCSQTAWLPNRTIRECVLGLGWRVVMDDDRYNTALEACCLKEDLHSLSDGDFTVVGTEGQNLSGGQRQRVALARAIYSQRNIVLLDDSFSALDTETRNQVINNLLGPNGLLRKQGMTVLWTTSSTSFFQLSDKIILMAEGSVKFQGTWELLKFTEPRFIQEDSASLIELKQVANNDMGLQRGKFKNRLPGGNNQAGFQPQRDQHRKDGDLSLYGYYFKAAGVWNILLLLVFNASYSFFSTFPQYWLKWWTESTGHTAFYVTGYISLLVIAWVSTNGTKWSGTLRLSPESGIVLHHRLLETILNAPLTYFSKTDIGTTLNRFSQDIQLVDKQISSAFSSLTVQIFKLVTQAAVLFAVQPYMSITLPVCVGVIYVVQKVYLRTSRQLRRLELEFRSGVYFNFLETVHGLATIRAFGWQGAIAEENAACVDNSQQPLYLLLCLQRWLNVILNSVVAWLAVGTVWLAVESPLASTATGGRIGVALNVILVTNATLMSLIQAWTNLEVSLGAIARLREVIQDTPQEEEKKAKVEEPEWGRASDLPGNWPFAGGIEFSHAVASYNIGEPVLQGVNLTIEHGQVAVICGRTGSGKSSLLLSLLRLLELQYGHIRVDGIDLSTLPLDEIRDRAFVTVGQDPLVLPDASLRFHLDPSDTLPDSALADALQKTKLYDVLSSTESDSNQSVRWDEPLSSFPVLSAGQAQLLSLARALLQIQVAANGSGYRRKPIVLLDEITASLDAATEAAVYDVVEDVFVRAAGTSEDASHGHTVLMVTHRLGGLTGRLRPGRDVVVWMDAGVVEKIESVGQVEVEQVPRSSYTVVT